MTFLAVTLCILCQALIVVGQLFLKHAITSADAGATATAPRPSRATAARDFAIGVGCMAVWFFLWLGLMSKWDLSKLYPFEGLNPVMMAIGAWLVLKEKLPGSAWVGLALVCAGIVVVSRS